MLAVRFDAVAAHPIRDCPAACHVSFARNVIHVSFCAVPSITLVEHRPVWDPRHARPLRAAPPRNSRTLNHTGMISLRPFLPFFLPFFLPAFLSSFSSSPKRTSVVSSWRTKERRERERANVRKNVGAVRRCAMKNVQGPKAVRASEKGPLRNGSGYRFNKCLDTVVYGYECRSTATNLSAFSLDVQTKEKITGWS